MASRPPSSRPASHRSSQSIRSERSRPSSKTTEETPLLSRESRYPSDDEHQLNSEPAHPRSRAESSLLRSLHVRLQDQRKWRWPSLVALLLLFLAITLIIVVRFLGPQAVAEYAKRAVDFRPTNISLDSLTENGVRIHVKGEISLNASKVPSASVRRIGRFATWIAKEVESGPADVNIYLPDYDGERACIAKIPGIKIDLRNTHVTPVDFLADIEPESVSTIRNLVNDLVEGRISHLRLLGKAEVPLKSGIINVGIQKFIHEMTINDEKSPLPSLPTKELNISSIRIHPGPSKGVRADADVKIPNKSIFGVVLPAIGFDVLVDNCDAIAPRIAVARGTTGAINIQPNSNVSLSVSAFAEKIPDELTKKCEGLDNSPMDNLTYAYSHGLKVPLYARCCSFPDPDTPQWASDLLGNFMTVPVPIEGKPMDHLLQNFSLTDTHFSLPEPLATPGTPEAQPRISAKVQVLVAIPEELNVALNVSRVRADTMVYHKSKVLGKLDLSEWQQANTTRLDADDGKAPPILVEAQVHKAPLEILDEDVFTEVIQLLLFGGKTVRLSVKAEVDVEVITPLGTFVVRQLPAEGVVPVKPISPSDNGLGSVKPVVHGLQIVETTPRSLTIEARVDFTNPTNYSAVIPYISINVLSNNTVLGHAIAESISVNPGHNTNVAMRVIWDPTSASGEDGGAVGRELISQYLSGYNTTLSLKTYNGTIPSQPLIGEALSRFTLEVPIPHLRTPNDPSKTPDDGDSDDPDDERKPHFITSTTLHILSSTAVFSIMSPLNRSTLYIETLNATAWYHDASVGRIVHDLPFAIPPGASDSPYLPVDWSLKEGGFDPVKKALGGTLHLNASAEVTVRLGRWKDRLWFRGQGIGVHVRL